MGSVLVGLVGALVVGLLLGRITEKARRARSDYIKTRQLVLGMRKASVTAFVDAARAVIIVGGVLLVAFLAMYKIGSFKP